MTVSRTMRNHDTPDEARTCSNSLAVQRCAKKTLGVLRIDLSCLDGQPGCPRGEAHDPTDFTETARGTLALSRPPFGGRLNISPLGRSRLRSA